MVWDPDAVGCRDDSFKGGGWDPFGYGVDVDQIDGDYVELIVRTGETQGYIEKYGISFDAAVYKYLVLGLWGDGDYYVEVYDGAWKTAKVMGDAPDTYDIVIVDLSGVTTGTITGLRLGVGSAAGKKVTYDFFEFMSRPPVFPNDLIGLRVLQREGEVDAFEMETMMNRVVGDDCVLLMQMDEGLGPTAFDDSMYGNHGDITGASWVTDGLDFNGATDYLTVTHHASLNPPKVTIIVWIELDTVAVAEQDVLDKRGPVAGGYNLRLADDDLCFVLKNSVGTEFILNAVDVMDTEKHTIGGTWDGTNQRLYLDGEEVASATPVVDDITGSTNPLRIAEVAIAAPPVFPFDGKVYAALISSRVFSPFEMKRIHQQGPPSRVYVKARHIRIVTGRDSNVEKIFAGVIEESNLKTGGLREVGGRCFQVKLQAATKTKAFDDRELSLAVKDLIEDFEEISTGRVKTPSPAINVRKDYADAHIVDILDQLASLPSKQSPYETWRWKLGYGQDLRFRSENDGDVPTCSTSIVEGTNLLVGVRKGSDVYELFNKVKALSGEVEYPFEIDEWTGDHAPWSIEYQMNCTNPQLGSGVSEGHPYVMIAGDLLQYIRIARSVPSVDLTKFKGLRVWLKRDESVNKYPKIDLKFGTNNSNCFHTEVDIGTRNMVWVDITTDDLSDWDETGTPDLTDVTWIALQFGWPQARIGNVSVAEWQFYAENMEATATDTESVIDHDRVYVYKDAKINQVEKLQDLADGLLHAMKAAANRILLPVVGAPDLQRGHKVQVTSASFGLSGSYPILEAEQILGREVGYLTVVMIQKGRYALPADLRRTLERELRLEKLGTVTIQ